MQQSHDDLRQFAYIISHDLQEPLRMVTSYLQLLERRYQRQLDADAQEFIAYAVDGASRMHTLINDLLAYSSVNTKGRRLHKVSSAAALADALANLRLAIEESNAVVTHDELPEILSDSSQLTQVFQNLIGNALKFRNTQTPAIHIGVLRQNGEWVFSVRDNGIGFDPEATKRIFLIFQRLHTRSEYPGTGIGLAICKRIVENHGGHIRAESAPGQGATFHFSIPDQKGTH